MRNDNQLARLSRVSREKHNISIDLDWRHPKFFDFLQLSPSYRLAHRIAKGWVIRDQQRLPNDFLAVERTYKAFGSVYRTHFNEWWTKVAQFQFGVSILPRPETLLRVKRHENMVKFSIAEATQAVERYVVTEREAIGMPSALIVAVPLTRDRERILRELAQLLEQEYSSESEEWISNILIAGMRQPTVNMAMRALTSRIAVPHAKLYQVGNYLKFAPAYITKSNKPRSPGEAENRRMMEIVTARQLNRAYLLAENAARGHFPSIAPLSKDPARPVFDYVKLRKQTLSYIEWGQKFVEKENQKREALKAREKRKKREMTDDFGSLR